MIPCNKILKAAFLLATVSTCLADKESRIFGGFDAKLGQFPYTVTIVNTDKTFFGGSLISHNVILTSASELQFKDPFDIYLGTIAARDPAYTDGIRVNSSKYVVHPQFDSVDHENDIGLLTLEGSFYIEGIIEPIRLPSRQQQESDFIDEVGTISGIGITASGNKINQQFLKSRIMNNDDCKNEWTLSEIFPTQLCTKSRGSLIAPCHGDQGGPLTVEETDGLPTQVGISSLFNCGRDYPHVYTRVSAYLEWIAANGGPPMRDVPH